MNNIQKLENVSLYFGVFVGSILTNISYDYLKTHGLSDYLLTVILFLVLAVSIQALSAMSRTIIKQSSWVRRIIVGDDYIEGIWVDVAEHNGSKSYGLFIVRYVKNSFHVVGKEFDDQGQVIYDWQSINSSFDGDRLIYLYSTHTRLGHSVADNYGVSSLTFIRSGPNKFPKSATGYFIDAALNFRKVVTTAEKKSNHVFKTLNNIDETRKFILEWISSNKAC